MIDDSSEVKQLSTAVNSSKAEKEIEPVNSDTQEEGSILYIILLQIT